MDKPNFVKRKQPNKIRAIVLLVVLILILVLWLNLDKIMEMVFN